MTNVLLVCTGNICRTPIAEATFRRELDAHGARGIRVASAGTGAWPGTPPSEGAYLIGLENDLDLSEHRATLLTREVVADSDLILTMSRHHRQRCEELGGKDKTFVLGEYAGRTGPEAEVSDPYGSDLDVYRETYQEIVTLTEAAVARLLRGVP